MGMLPSSGRTTPPKLRRVPLSLVVSHNMELNRACRPLLRPSLKEKLSTRFCRVRDRVNGVMCSLPALVEVMLCACHHYQKTSSKGLFFKARMLEPVVVCMDVDCHESEALAF